MTDTPEPPRGLAAVLSATLWSARIGPPGGPLRLPSGPVRPREGRMLLGVCAGLARVFGWDAWVVRALLLLGVVWNLGAGFYAVLWLLMPAEGTGGRARSVAAWLLLALVGAAAGLGTAAQLAAMGVPPVAAAALGSVAGTALLLVSRSPLLVWRLLVAVLVLALVAVGLWGEGPLVWPEPLPWPLAALAGLLVAVFLVALRHDRAVAVCATAVAVLAVVAPAPLLAAAPVYSPAVLAAGLAAAAFLGDSARTRRAAQRRLAEQAELHRRDLAQRAVLQERFRIARELHDIVAHHMSVIAVQAEAAPFRSPDLPDPARAGFAAISSAARAALTETRRLVAVLREDPSEPETASDRLPQPGLDRLDEAADSARGSGAEVTVSVVGIPVPIPAGTDVSAYRIVQEALSNAIRHAPGAATEVTVGYRPHSLTLRIANGPAEASPRPDAAGGGHGLIGMRERALALGGSFNAGPEPDGGFTVRAELPIDGAEAE